MDARELRELIEGIIRRAAPYVAASSMGLALAACECPVNTYQEDRQTTVSGVTWAKAVAAAGTDGALPPELCAELCAGETRGAEVAIDCHLPYQPPAPSADVAQGGDVAGQAGDEALDESGTVVCTVEFEEDCGGVGRRPEGLEALAGATTGGPVGRYFAEACAHEEGAAEAFRILADELERHGAPARLVDEARRAVVEEEQHAVVTRLLSDRWGGSARQARVPDTRGRSLAAIAMENAAEGCVEETYGAALASWQSLHATDPAIRTSLGLIAREETGHAAWSWRLHAWALPQLAPEEREAVLARMQGAVDGLAERVRRARAAELIEVAGDAHAEVGQHIFDELKATVWRRNG